VSPFRSTSLTTFPSLSPPLSLDIKPDPELLERVLVRRVEGGNGSTEGKVDHLLSQIFSTVSKDSVGAVAPHPTPADNLTAGGGLAADNAPVSAQFDSREQQPDEIRNDLPGASVTIGRSNQNLGGDLTTATPVSVLNEIASVPSELSAQESTPAVISTEAKAARIELLADPAYTASDGSEQVNSVPPSELPHPTLNGNGDAGNGSTASQLGTPPQDFFQMSTPPLNQAYAPPVVTESLSSGKELEKIQEESPLLKGNQDFFSSAPPVQGLSDKTSRARLADNSETSGSAPSFVTTPQELTELDPDLHSTVEKAVALEDLLPERPATSSKADESASASGEEEEEPPHRRSFSGKSKFQDKAQKGSTQHGVDEEEEDHHDHAPLPRGGLSEEISYFGFQITKLNAVIVSLVLIAFLFLSFRVFAGVISGLSSENIGLPFTNKVAAQNLSGMWRVAVQTAKKRVFGRMRLHVKDGQIFGDGKDNSGGYFQFTGTAKGNGEIEFTKQYMRGGSPTADRPVHFTGQIQPDSNPPFMQGEYQVTYMKGGRWRGNSITETNIWEADLIQPAPGGDDGAGPAPTPRFANKPGNLVEFGMKTALGLLVFAVAVLVFMWTGFGPNGWRSRLEKAKYIPSQFLGPHRKDRKELSQPLKPGGIPLGQRCEWRIYYPWEQKDLAIPPPVRVINPHILMLGSGDKGKSRLMAKMIAHDIEAGDRAVVVIDSDGGLSDLISRWVASHHRAKEWSSRISIIDPTYREGSLAYNPLEMPEDGDLQGAASSLVYGFKAIYSEPPGSQTQWNKQTANILRNAALLLMINNRTLTDLPTLLQDNDFRDVLLEGVEKRKKERVEYGTLLETWGQYKRLARTDQWINWVEPILNRITPMLSDPRIRPILTKEKGEINLREIVKGKRILIVKIPQGQLDQNANLLGSLLVTGLKQASLSVAFEHKDGLRPIALYLDEFQNFIEKETFDAISSDTKKFQIGFVGASKSLQDLPEDFRNQLIINVGCLACFSLAKKDGDMLGPQMFRVDGRKKKHETLQNFINPINTTPQFELISDEEKLNIDRLVGQTERTYFLYRVGTVAGVFHLKTHPFHDIPEKHVNQKILRKMHGLKSDNSVQSA
jgi:hypothetical protein